MTPVWRAFAYMSRAAARDPLWALACVVFGPFRGGVYLAKCLLVALTIAIVLLFAVEFAGQKGAWPTSARPHRARRVCALRQPPSDQSFSDMASDTRGLVRFAERKEVWLLAKAAPTRAGKGVDAPLSVLGGTFR